ncbi:hypothetical protein [Pseudosulfitobacter sp. SM2401]|uniref:hypothetical protein n=1 Tax=Pseudosulfitobacter sp. SM2401 TaxID=3350098 RepID=UPI0036F26C5D
MIKHVFTPFGTGIASAFFSEKFSLLDISTMDLVTTRNHVATLPARFNAKACDSGERK